MNMIQVSNEDLEANVVVNIWYSGSSVAKLSAIGALDPVDLTNWCQVRK